MRARRRLPLLLAYVSAAVAMTGKERLEWRDSVKEMFYRAQASTFVIYFFGVRFTCRFAARRCLRWLHGARISPRRAAAD